MATVSSCTMSARYTLHEDAIEELQALIRRQASGEYLQESEVKSKLDSLLLEPRCRFFMRGVKEFRANKEPWYSEPFYSGPHGYKFRLIIYANGYGDAQGNNLSVFVQILDEPAHVPFRGSVTVILVNQTSNHDNLKRKIEFNHPPVFQPASSSFVDHLPALQPNDSSIVLASHGQPYVTPGLGPRGVRPQDYHASSRSHASPGPRDYGASSRERVGPARARIVGGRRVGAPNQHRHALPPRTKGIMKFAQLISGYNSPFEKDNMSIWEVSVVHMNI